MVRFSFFLLNVTKFIERKNNVRPHKWFYDIIQLLGTRVRGHFWVVKSQEYFQLQNRKRQILIFHTFSPVVRKIINTFSFITDINITKYQTIFPSLLTFFNKFLNFKKWSYNYRNLKIRIRIQFSSNGTLF